MPIEVESPEQLGYSTITNNLSESSVPDRRLSDLGLDVDVDGLLLRYGDHLGDPLLREAIAAQGDGLSAGDVTVTPGAAAALFCAATAILSPGDHAIVVRTNYATNLETPRAINADVDIVDLEYENGWALDVGKLQSRVRPGRTKMISVTCPHNPTGTMLEFEWVPPRGGVVGFVRFRPGVAVDTGAFYRRLLADHGTCVGAGHWFEVSDRYFRLGYGWPTRAELRDGLAGLTAAAGQGDQR